MNRIALDAADLAVLRNINERLASTAEGAAPEAESVLLHGVAASTRPPRRGVAGPETESLLLHENTARKVPWAGMFLPHDVGGLGGGMREAVLLLYATGRSLLSPSLLSSAILAPRLLEQLATPRQRAEWLPRLARGESAATICWRDEDDRLDPSGITIRGRRARNQLRLSGQKLFVPDAGRADLLLVVCRTSGRAGAAAGISVCLVPTATEGVHCRPLLQVDPVQRLFEVRFDDVALEPQSVLGREGQAWRVLDRLGDAAAIGLAAESLGGLERVLELCSDEREGSPAARAALDEASDRIAPALALLLDAARACEARARDAAKRAAGIKALVGDLFVSVAESALAMNSAAQPEVRGWLARAQSQRALYGAPEVQRERYATLSGW